MSSEIAWAAGLFEGEGSIYVDDSDARRRQGKTRIGMSLSSTDHDVIDRFRIAVRCGKVYGPYRSTKGTKDHWVWHLRDADQIAVLFRILDPYLGVRRREGFRQTLATKRAADERYRPKTLGRPRPVWVSDEQLVLR